jgi:hypothetical protein
MQLWGATLPPAMDEKVYVNVQVQIHFNLEGLELKEIFHGDFKGTVK